MREELKKINEVRSTFRATLERMGTKSSFGHPKPTMLFKDVRDNMGRRRSAVRCAGEGV